jgi:Domain of unknown function (DUF4157)/Lysine-specific metallo-endopeptidase
VSTRRTVTGASAVPMPILTLQRPILQRSCDCGEHTEGGECEACQKMKGAGLLHRHAAESASSIVAPPIVHDVLRSPGQPLDSATQAVMQSRFRRDFSQVRVHTDERAAESARAVSAHAYTVGQNIVFGEGRYSPRTQQGRSLLRHELTHVLQQSAAPYTTGELLIGETRDDAEREAAQMESKESGGSIAVNHSSPHRLQGSWDWDRAEKGALIGGGLGVAGGGIALLAGDPGLAAGLLAGGVVGGFLLGGFTGSKKKQPVTAQQPHLPAGCNADQTGKIITGMQRGLEMTRRTISALNELQPGTKKDRQPSRAAEALTNDFKSDSKEVANYVRDRFVQIQEMISSLLRQSQQKPQQTAQQVPTALPAIGCHSPADDDTCKRATAYVGELKPGQKTRDSMVFCTSYFERSDLKSDDARGAVIIHEVAHAIMGGRKSIQDIAYTDDRFFRDLTTAEALTNADSYRLFVLQVGSDSGPIFGGLADFVDGCDAKQQTELKKALALAQRWVSVARKAVYNRDQGWLTDSY